MSRVPSSEILAKDVIGFAQELVKEEEARLLIKNLAIEYYNAAITEIYNVIMIISPNMFDYFGVFSSANNNLTILSGDRIYRGSLLSSDFGRCDKIINVSCFSDGSHYQCFNLENEQFQSFYETDGAQFPYSEAVVYRTGESSIDFCFGESIVILEPILTARFQRMPERLNSTNYMTLKMGVPDRYYSLLANRIASYAEIRKGVTDGSFAIIKNMYEQLMTPISEKMKMDIKNIINVGE